MIGGITANLIRLYVRMDWNTKVVLKIGKAHRYFGWCVVLVSQFVLGTGYINFYTYDGYEPLGWGIAGTSAALFFTFLIIGEVWFQIQLRKEITLIAPEATMTQAEFE